MAYDPMVQSISAAIAGILIPVLMTILDKLEEKRKPKRDMDWFDFCNKDELIIYYLLVILWSVWTFLIISIIIGRIDYSIVAPISYFVITAFVIMAYLWSHESGIYLVEHEMVKKSGSIGKIRKSTSDIIGIELKTSILRSKVNAVIEFSDGSKIKVHHWYTGYDYFIYELRKRLPQYVWKYAR